MQRTTSSPTFHLSLTMCSGRLACWSFSRRSSLPLTYKIVSNSRVNAAEAQHSERRHSIGGGEYIATPTPTYSEDAITNSTRRGTDVLEDDRVPPKAA